VSAAIGALLGLCCAAGILLGFDALRRRPRARLTGRTRGMDRATRLRLAAGVGAGLLVEVALGWPVAALLVAAGVVLLPPLLGSRRAARRQEARLEAVATWAEMLRDNLRAASGLQQAIVATATAPPEAILPEVTRLAADLSRRIPLTIALHTFAATLGDPVADLVVGQLTLAATAQAGQLSKTLSTVADQAREHVAMRLDVEADRAGIRTQIRMVIVTTVLLAAGLILFRRPFLHPYDTLTGQLVLVVIGAGGFGAFALLARLSRFAQAPRLFTTTGTGGGAR
jgi:tight adherence protein B